MTYDSISALADADRSSAAVKAENILRQRLRISNPHDPREVIEGLRRLFPDQAAALDREASGLPSGLADLYRRPAAVPVSGASATEFDRAQDRIETELRALGSDNQLKDVDAEIEGWGQAIRTLVAGGRSAAQMALDPRARDRALASRRQLCDYARMVRLAGASNPAANPAYRRLAQSIDTAAALILVSAGEAMAELGVAGGQVILAAPVSELQARRDAVIGALRCLNGTAEGSCDDFPRGVHGLRTLLRRLHDGHSELLAYLDENAMARLLDDLIDHAANGTGRGLRVLSAAASVPLAQLERIAAAASSIDEDSPSPTISRLVNTLALFIETFQQSSGHRMLAISRAAIVQMGLQGSGIRDAGAARLQKIVELRGYLAQHVDCLMGCDCERERVAAQILIDGLLAGIDRAIDLYVAGTDQNGRGNPERRAVAYGLLCIVFTLLIDEACNLATTSSDAPEDQIGRVLEKSRGLREIIQALAWHLLDPLRDTNYALATRMATNNDGKSDYMDEIFSYWRTENRWLDMAPRFTAMCTMPTSYLVLTNISSSSNLTYDNKRYLELVICYVFKVSGVNIDRIPPLTYDVPYHRDTSLGIMAEAISSRGWPPQSGQFGQSNPTRSKP
ncbi:hypothetical protein [Methylobacterium tarhaniae]|uniref:hypothetical protein n=1 Tax=Methylobacterium tarhaniae TaxID=1187852 RepID=UPI003D004C98